MNQLLMGRGKFVGRGLHIGLRPFKRGRDTAFALDDISRDGGFRRVSRGVCDDYR
jgi:hypothetical protein